MNEQFAVAIEECTFLTMDGVELIARAFVPQGIGPFPAVVDAHGGAWIIGDRTINDPINQPIAKQGVMVLAISYRMPPQGTYPCSVADMNYAIRWLKLNAQRFNVDPQRVGTMGTSAGGHLAVLTALKPHDARYSALPLPECNAEVDARVFCTVTMWPVICPPSRYRDNMERHDRRDDLHADRVGAGLDQMKYWLNEEAMTDGSPVKILEREEAVNMPPMLYVQAYCDVLHPRHSMDRFMALYTAQGGSVEALMFEGEPYDLVRVKPDAQEAKRVVDRIAQFIQSCAPLSHLESAAGASADHRPRAVTQAARANA